VIGSLTIDDGQLKYLDPAQDIELTSVVNQVLAEGAEGDRQLTLKGESRFQGKPFSPDLNAGSLNRLRDDEEPYPIDLSVRVGETKASVAGTIMRPLDVRQVDMDLSICGSDLADLFPIVGISLPPSPPYSLEGHLTQEGAVWDFKGVRGQVGESDLCGDIKVDLTEEHPTFFATLTSRKLRFEDLSPFVGADPSQTNPEKEDEGVLPDDPIDLNRLRAMDARVVFSGQEILAPGLPINDLEFTAELSDGRLILQPIEFGVADGEAAGTITLDGQRERPQIEADVDIREVRLKPFFEATEFFDSSTGLIGGHLDLRGGGNSIAEIMGASNGRLVVAMTGGYRGVPWRSRVLVLTWERPSVSL